MPIKRIKMPIRRKLFSYMLLVSMVPVILVTILATNNVYTALYDQLISSSEASMAWLSDKLDLSAQEFLDTFYSLEYDEQFRQDILNWSNGSGSYECKRRLMSALRSTVFDSRISSIELYNIRCNEILTVSRSGASVRTNVSTDNIWGNRGDKLQKNLVFKHEGKRLFS